ncbi:sugar phosphate nucleotidyltransferase [Nitrospiraceae bacterium AH_259_D15_M11_P09]|nr:sugar phosphate nucleotidyltransferase [Nitrospiraceae bacterium AH_259_D15_M11_P09]
MTTNKRNVADTSLPPHAVILAGGFGTRLQSSVPDCPKSLAPVVGRPFLAYQLDWLRSQGISTVTLAIHYLAEQVVAFVSEWKSPNLALDYVREEIPLGTGGAVMNVVQEKGLDGDLLVLNGDTQYRFSLMPVLERYRSFDESALLIAAHVEDVARFGTLTIEKDRVTSFHQATGRHEPGLVSTGAYLLHATLFQEGDRRPFSMEDEFFPALAEKEELAAYVLNHGENFFDIGTPESYEDFCASANKV